ncbi:hypothetical protein BMS3Abin13_00385 [bacterium BMS3Abin13]|nr:hypothetical protein BMS3Abin13_00385 [bacterium BMS3Abin13]
MEKNLDFTPNPKLKLMEQSSGSITVILPPADAKTTYFSISPCRNLYCRTPVDSRAAGPAIDKKTPPSE